MAEDQDEEPLWIACARQVWGAHWQRELCRYFGKGRAWANHMAHGRVSVPDDLLDYLREVLLAHHQKTVRLIGAIDEPANRAWWREQMDAASVGADDF